MHQTAPPISTLPATKNKMTVGMALNFPMLQFLILPPHNAVFY